MHWTSFARCCRRRRAWFGVDHDCGPPSPALDLLDGRDVRVPRLATISRSRHRFLRESGLVSSIRTVSPSGTSRPHRGQVRRLTLDVLAVLRVRLKSRDFDGARLPHPIAGDDPDLVFGPWVAPQRHGRGSLSRRFGGCCSARSCSPPALGCGWRCRMTVSIRAMSFRRDFSSLGFACLCPSHGTGA
jgi:hypothetical protein